MIFFSKCHTRIALVAVAAMITASFHSTQAATEADARAITQAFDKSYRAWTAEMKLAAAAGSAHVAAKKRPDAAAASKRLKSLISKDLAKDWTLDYAAWLLENDTALTPEHQRALLDAVEKNHVKSPRLGRFCMGLIYLDQGAELPKPGQPPVRTRGMNLLKRVKNENPDPKVQGQASLALSMMLASLGDDPRIMQGRIKNLREAIIKSAEIPVGELTVAQIAEDELYKIKHLTKGRLAPPIQGVDSGGRAMQLAQFKGKVVMLVFWSSWDAETAVMQRLLEGLRKTTQSNLGKPIEVIGVNRDSRQNLRTLEADGLVTWKNFSDQTQKIANDYRVATWPYCLVLDQQGVIRYRGNVGALANAVANDLILRTKPDAETKPAGL
ncbi:TlpA family protein disulfide reductase [Verrucomicrobiaceae bacterium N1E253]|uniref:TlpA family protein disulfide reductase n=1 Tax=Oceaniferula marina TaxID=2748318 RepID=A0A851GHU3_9BACT|nr:TlpA disulfide reductase family protein [Oceaniferula marina]NWK56926.1 TlpA family protein disulfide reductase [Oceaniferula marina]